MFPEYIVLAHLPISEDDPEFSGEFGLLPCEWVIYDGPNGRGMAEAKATKLRKHFSVVQIRKVSEEI